MSLVVVQCTHLTHGFAYRVEQLSKQNTATQLSLSLIRVSNYFAHSGSPPTGSRVPTAAAWGSATDGCSCPPRCARIPCCSSSHRGSVCSSPGRAAPAWRTPHRSSVRRSDMSRGESSCAALCRRGCIINIHSLLSPVMIAHYSPKYGWAVDSASTQPSSSPRLRMTTRVNIAARRFGSSGSACL